jgi:hypothetical protein
MHFMLLALFAFASLATPQAAKASCGYYVIIGHPSGQTATEQAGVRQDQLPQQHQKLPCDGPQCRRHDPPMNPPQLITVLSHDAIWLAVTKENCDEGFIFALPDECSLLSDPHIWRIDPPPRA